MPIKFLLLVILIFSNSNIKSQNSLPNYRGGESQFYEDVNNSIHIPIYGITKKSKSHFSQAFMYISKLGKIDSISFKKGSLNNFDSAVLSSLLSTEKKWNKSKK